MSTGKAQPQASQFPPLNEIGAKTLDAVSALAEANQRVVGMLIELSSSAASDRLRAMGELGAVAVETARANLAPTTPREAFEEFRRDPVAWYRESFRSALGNTQQVFRLIETNAQIASRTAERLQASAEQTGKEIESAVSACASKLREIYGSRAF
jgi:hypothetical protein